MTGEGNGMRGVGGDDKVSNNGRRFLRFGRNDRRGDFYRRDDYYEFAKDLEE